MKTKLNVKEKKKRKKVGFANLKSSSSLITGNVHALSLPSISSPSLLESSFKPQEYSDIININVLQKSDLFSFDPLSSNRRIRYFQDLLEEVIVLVFSFLSHRDVLSGACVNVSWNRLSHDAGLTIQRSNLSRFLTCAGGCRTFVIDSKTCFAWGENRHGKCLGIAPRSCSSVPQVISSLSNKVIRLISAGSDHTLAITLDGRCYSWGGNDYGQLGLGHTMDCSKPKLIGALRKKVISAASAGSVYSVVVTNKGKCYAWGANEYGQLGIGKFGHFLHTPTAMLITDVTSRKVRLISAGGRHVVAVSDDGKCYAWGDNEYGQLGIDKTTLSGLQNPQDDNELTNNQLVRRKGTKNRNHRYLSSRSRSCVAHPVVIDDLEDKQVIVISAGGLHSIALTVRGQCYSWGYNRYGQLGINHNNNCVTPQHLSFFSGKEVNLISAGYTHTVAVTIDGECFAWGENSNGQLGIGNKKSCATPQPVLLNRNKIVHAISAGYFHTVAVTVDGKCFAWGGNHYGQLGTGNRKDSSIPKYIPNISLSRSTIITKNECKWWKF